MDSEPWWVWRTGTSKVKRTGWLEWTGADDLRSPIRGPMEPVTSAARDRGIWTVDDLPSGTTTKEREERGDLLRG